MRRIVGLITVGLMLLGFIAYANATVSDVYEPVLVLADGNTTSYDFNFKVFNTSQVVVTEVNSTTLVPTNKTLAVDYNVTLTRSVPGGTVVFDTAPSNTSYVSIRRNIPLTQTTDIPAGGLFREQQIENALDKQMLVAQQLKEAVDRALLQSPYSNITNMTFPAPSSDKIIGWNFNATELENKEALNATVLASAQTLLNDTTTAKLAAQAAQLAAETARDEAEAVANFSVDTDVNLTANSDIKIASQKATKTYVDTSVAAVNTSLSVKIGIFTKNTTDASGDTAYTGVGFVPSAVIFLMARDDSGAYQNSIGIDDNVTRTCLNDVGSFVGGTFNLDNNSSSIMQVQGGSTTYSGKVKSFDADGFTINWTKQGSTSGVMRVGYLAVR